MPALRRAIAHRAAGSSLAVAAWPAPGRGGRPPAPRTARVLFVGNSLAMPTTCRRCCARSAHGKAGYDTNETWTPRPAGRWPTAGRTATSPTRCAAAVRLWCCRNRAGNARPSWAACRPASALSGQPARLPALRATRPAPQWSNTPVRDLGARERWQRIADGSLSLRRRRSRCRGSDAADAQRRRCSKAQPGASLSRRHRIRPRRLRDAGRWRCMRQSPAARSPAAGGPAGHRAAAARSTPAGVARDDPVRDYPAPRTRRRRQRHRHPTSRSSRRCATLPGALGEKPCQSRRSSPAGVSSGGGGCRRGSGHAWPPWKCLAARGRRRPRPAFGVRRSRCAAPGQLPWRAALRRPFNSRLAAGAVKHSS